MATVINTSVGLQARAGAWRVAKWNESNGLSRFLQPTPGNIMAKAGEELGEFNRAVIGILEGREGRGIPVQEAAQVIIVLLTYFGIHEPDEDLYEVVESEMVRLGA